MYGAFVIVDILSLSKNIKHEPKHNTTDESPAAVQAASTTMAAAAEQQSQQHNTQNEREQCYVVPAVMSFAASFYPCHSIVSRIERPLLCKQQILLNFAAHKGTGILSVLR